MFPVSLLFLVKIDCFCFVFSYILFSKFKKVTKNNSNVSFPKLPAEFLELCFFFVFFYTRVLWWIYLVHAATNITPSETS